MRVRPLMFFDSWTRLLVAGLVLSAASACTGPVEAPGGQADRVATNLKPEPKQSPPPDLTRGLKGRTPILTYHDVIETRGPGALWFDCTREEFIAQLDRLSAQGAVFTSLDELYGHMVAGIGIPEKAIVLTFADNYSGFYKRALPELRRRRIPAAMFVHTGFVGSAIGRSKMDWPQLRELAREGLVTICSQTVSHPFDLTALDDKSLRSELADSKAKLEGELGIPVRYLAYPNGKFDSRCAEAARIAGYAMAFTEEQRPAETAVSAWTVPRYVHTKWAKAWKDKWAPARP